MIHVTHWLGNLIRRTRRTVAVRRLAWTPLIALVLLTWATPAIAQRVIRTRPTPSDTFNAVLPFTLGGSVEYERTPEQREWTFPLLLEYTFSEQLQFTLEPQFVHIDGRTEDTTDVSGLGDTEATVQYEFLRERRYTPALTAIGTIKFPTATDPNVGNHGFDYSAGLTLSKDLVLVDVDLSLLYTFSGDPDSPDSLELSLSGQYAINHAFDLEAEVVETLFRDGGGHETEATIGLAWHASPYLKLEGGVTFKDDGTQQFILAWEYSFAGEN